MSVVPVRTEPSDKAEIGTQLLFGDSFSIIKKSEDGKWAYIQIYYDEYFGWIDSKQFKEVTKEYFDTYNNNPVAMTKGLMGLMKGERSFFPVMMGSTLPFYNNGIVRIADEKYEYEGEYFYPQQLSSKAIENTARFYLSSPYLWGGKCHFGIDCSGFTQQVYKLNGYKLPRDSYKQAEVGETISFGDHALADLAYFHNVNGKIIHVGIVLPEGLIIHASGEVRIDILDSVGIFNVDRKVYSHKLALIKRII